MARQRLADEPGLGPDHSAVLASAAASGTHRWWGNRDRPRIDGTRDRLRVLAALQRGPCRARGATADGAGVLDARRPRDHLHRLVVVRARGAAATGRSRGGAAAAALHGARALHLLRAVPR